MKLTGKEKEGLYVLESKSIRGAVKHRRSMDVERMIEQKIGIKN